MLSGSIRCNGTGLVDVRKSSLVSFHNQRVPQAAFSDQEPAWLGGQRHSIGFSLAYCFARDLLAFCNLGGYTGRACARRSLEFPHKEDELKSFKLSSLASPKTVAALSGRLRTLTSDDLKSLLGDKASLTPAAKSLTFEDLRILNEVAFGGRTGPVVQKNDINGCCCCCCKNG